jgi:hypothetical protein
MRVQFISIIDLVDQIDEEIGASINFFFPFSKIKKNWWNYAIESVSDPEFIECQEL